jgi:hypothetical protein
VNLLETCLELLHGHDRLGYFSRMGLLVESSLMCVEDVRLELACGHCADLSNCL